MGLDETFRRMGRGDPKTKQLDFRLNLKVNTRLDFGDNQDHFPDLEINK